MPQVRMPDGAIVAFPDDMPPDQIKSMIASKFPEVVGSQRSDAYNQAASEMSAMTQAVDKPMETNTLADVGRSALSGIRQGAEGLAGAIGSANAVNGQVASWLAGKFGASPEMAERIGSITRRVSPAPMAATTEQVQAVTNNIGGEPYEPKTVAGQYARTVGEFAPAAATGPGGLVRKAAMAVVPALASETAGQVTKGTAAEPWARVGGALVGGGLAAGGKPSAVKLAAKGAPTTADLKAQTDQFYQALRDAGIKYDANYFGATLQNATNKLLKAGYRQSAAPEAFGYIDDLMKGVGKSPDFDDINGAIQVLGEMGRGLARNPDTRARGNAVNMLRDALMKFEETAPFSSNTPMSSGTMSRVRSMARQTALKRIKGRVLDEILENADTYQSGQEAGIRNQIGNLIRSKRGQQLFNAEERKALLDVANGHKGLRTLSRFGFDLHSIGGNATLLPTLGATAAGAIGGVPVGAALIGAGTVAKELSPRLTSRAFEQASSAVRSGRLRDPAVMSQVTQEQLQANLRRLLAAGMAGRQISGQ